MSCRARSLIKQGHLVLAWSSSVSSWGRFHAVLRRTWQTAARSPSALSHALSVLTFNATGQCLVQGYTPLHHAAEKGATDIIEFLLARGADISAKDCNVSQHWNLLALTEAIMYNASIEPGAYSRKLPGMSCCSSRKGSDQEPCVEATSAECVVHHM